MSDGRTGWSHALCATVGLLAGSAAGAAQSCADPAHREFDFWIGEWQVQRADGSIAGINRIERRHGGCVIHERYATGRGYSGESLNVYDATRKVWHQTWVDSSGLLLVLEGRFDGKSMVLAGQTLDAGGERTEQRITWTPNADGSVRQLWESRTTGGDWTPVFDGLYTNTQR